MKFEKVDENKIKITLSIRDLEEKDINLHDFMSNSLESQELFLDMLEEAEKRVGFDTTNCKVKIETLAMTDESFVLTITKTNINILKKYSSTSRGKVKPIVRRKIPNTQVANLVYKFNSFDDYCLFINFLVHSKIKSIYKIANNICLYLYKGSYFLAITNLNAKYSNLQKFFNVITEFGSYVVNPDLFINKLKEYGIECIKNNAFKRSLTYFSKD